jgi:hypothetical protein
VCIRLLDLFSIFGISCGRDHYLAAEGGRERETFCDVEDVTTASITLPFPDCHVFRIFDRFHSGLLSARQDRTFHEVVILAFFTFLCVTVHSKVERSNT